MLENVIRIMSLSIYKVRKTIYNPPTLNMMYYFGILKEKLVNCTNFYSMLLMCVDHCVKWTLLNSHTYMYMDVNIKLFVMKVIIFTQKKTA